MPQRFALLTVFLFALLSASAPLHPRTEPPRETTGWSTQPPGRGTFQILLSCVLTLGLCVWTSIHQNVKGELEFLDHFKHKFNMAVMALFMPEKIISKAWDEWKQARELHRALIYESWVQKADDERAMLEGREKRFSDKGDDVAEGRAKWRKRLQAKCVRLLKAVGIWIDDDAFPKEVAFFVIMKGFVWSKNGKVTPVTAAEFFVAFQNRRIRPIKPNPSPAARKDGTTNTTTRTGAIDTDKTDAMSDKITEIPTGTVPRTDFIGIKIHDVLDKGKSTILAKLIICGQVGWMVLQLIGRGVMGLPLTLIELHTLIHIGIAVIRFWLWWYKPLDVGEPILLSMEFGEVECPGWSVRPKSFESKGISSFIDNLWLLPAAETRDIPAGIGRPPKCVDIPPKSTSNNVQMNSGTSVAVEGKTQDSENQVNSPPQVSIWAWIRNPCGESPFFNQPKPPKEITADSSPWSKQLTNWDKMSVQILRDNIFPCIFYFVYAGLHAAVWNQYFSTQAEQWFWRGACLVVGIAPSFVVFCGIIFGSVGRLIDRLTPGKNPVNEIHVSLGWIIYIIYLLASIGLLIEALISLRRLPVEAYKSVPWTVYIPHF